MGVTFIILAHRIGYLFLSKELKKTNKKLKVKGIRIRPSTLWSKKFLKIAPCYASVVIPISSPVRFYVQIKPSPCPAVALMNQPLASQESDKVKLFFLFCGCTLNIMSLSYVKTRKKQQTFRPRYASCFFYLYWQNWTFDSSRICSISWERQQRIFLTLGQNEVIFHVLLFKFCLVFRLLFFFVYSAATSCTIRRCYFSLLHVVMLMIVSDGH